MNKTTEALLARIEKLEAANKLAEEALEDAYRRDKHAAARWVYEQALTALSEALAEPVTISCDCGDIYERNSFGGKFIQQYGCCPNCDAAKPVQEPVALGNMKHVWDAALADAIAHSGNANETVGEPVKQEPVAVISESAIGLVKLHSNGVSLPFGTQLYAAPVEPVKQEPVVYTNKEQVNELIKESARLIGSIKDEGDQYLTAIDALRNAYRIGLKDSPVDAKAIRAEALEEAEEIAKTIGGSFSVEFLAAIRGLK